MFKQKTNKIHTESKLSYVERIITEKSDFNTVETYKTIRTNIMFSLPKKNHGKVIAMTSAAPGEGKTTTCINMAITFAQTGAKVIVVDCDLRKPRVHRYLEEERSEGVSNILCGFAEPENCIKKNVRENLDVLTSGEIPLNPAELLETQEFSKLIEELQQKYEYVFIDTPPVTIVTDALIVAKLCMGIVVVVKENSTTFDMLDKAMDYLKKTKTQILGVIMLGREGRRGKYGYYKSGKYGYRHKNDYSYRYGDIPGEK